MLDFYFIEDETAKPDYPNRDLEFAGSLDANVFERLVRKRAIDERFDYYSDFRWSELLLKQIRSNIEKTQLVSDTDIICLLKLIDPAITRKNGLIAFGD